MPDQRVAVIGAGIAGLTAAVDLARSGCKVALYERAPSPGGKLRELTIDGARLDAGPTVFTLRGIFDQLFADAGDDLDSRLTLVPAELLARHAWSPEARLDLYADLERSIDAIGRFAGPGEARAYARFAVDAGRVYATLERSFIQASRPSPLELVRRVGIGGLRDLWNIRPFVTLWRALDQYFADPRLRQLFARYATYCGSSPFDAPATLMLVAHVERSGVWYVQGGMHRLVEQLTALAQRCGVELHCATEVTEILLQGGRVCAVHTAAGERVAVDAVVCNADNNALATGLLGRGVAQAVRPAPTVSRSLSAMTWNLIAKTGGFPLAHHSVFFGPDYQAEFDAIFHRARIPSAPTIYVCAMDRTDDGLARAGGPERLFCLINAPATGDTHDYRNAEIESCEHGVFQRLADFGLQVARQPGSIRVTTPADFHRLFPATGGALYGAASHGWRASFSRATSRTRIPGLYLAGGGTHPGPGVPMAATSGRLAAAAITADCALTARSRTAAMLGGMSMR